MKAKNILIGTGIGAGLIWLANKLLAKKKVGDKLDTDIQVMVHAIDLKGLTLRMDVTLINPTEGTLTIKQPYIKLLYNQKDIGATGLANKKIIIPAYSPKKLDPIYLTIPAMGLFNLGTGLWSVLFKKQAAQITAKISTSIYLAGGFRNYETTQVINISPKKS